MCSILGRDGETGRRSGLKIRRTERSVGVQVPLPAPLKFPFRRRLDKKGPRIWQGLLFSMSEDMSVELSSRSVGQYFRGLQQVQEFGSCTALGG